MEELKVAFGWFEFKDEPYHEFALKNKEGKTVAMVWKNVTNDSCFAEIFWEDGNHNATKKVESIEEGQQFISQYLAEKGIKITDSKVTVLW